MSGPFLILTTWLRAIRHGAMKRGTFPTPFGLSEVEAHSFS